ncbi:MurR/RpiR family transcriptional regulator [Halalkalibacter urbisdiaboli]|uniref:MurR/RpiR family transcriptional regulator n=1 Tax=Halalkalibacter urbisdiaboli TaxID=1960589 RepID=UPI000B43272A|nr:MurR/RpiR family transcriptional regulator [Halalkalibacter urbisdiaboli]
MVHFYWDTKNMSQNQYKIAEYIQKNIHDVLFSTEQEIADQLDISIASVSRFWRAVGYKNLKEFKAKAKEQLEVTPARKLKNVLTKVDRTHPQNHFMENSVHHILETMNQFSSTTFTEAVETLTSAERIYLYGPGPSVGLAELMQYRIHRFGLSIHRFQRSGSELLEDLLHIRKDDVVVLFCFIRLLPEANVILAEAKRIGFRTIVITDRLLSTFHKEADVVLFTSRGELWEFHSMVAPTFMVENLIIAIGMNNQHESIGHLEQLDTLRRQYRHQLPR